MSSRRPASPPAAPGAAALLTAPVELHYPSCIRSGDKVGSGPADLDVARRVLESGGLVAFPTETVYGLGADATNPAAIARLYQARRSGRASSSALGQAGRAMPFMVANLATFHAGLRQVVLSATRRDMLEDQIRRFPIRHFFYDVLGLDDIYAGSKEEIGRAYLHGCGIPAEATVMLGDTLHDAEVARAIDAHCILIARGHQSRDMLETSGYPVVDTLEQAADLVLN